ncbi:hypothetical protein Franean1_3355 [Parafrankia sp. EAN1pec]|nr:hypothetical protein Franean1_3355 [Frankia sp. EAN1pec]
MTEFGLLTPVLSLVPGTHPGWERDGGSDDVRRIAEAADSLGHDYLTGSPPGPQMAHLVGAVDPAPLELRPAPGVRSRRHSRQRHPVRGFATAVTGDHPAGRREARGRPSVRRASSHGWSPQVPVSQWRASLAR